MRIEKRRPGCRFRPRHAARNRQGALVGTGAPARHLAFVLGVTIFLLVLAVSGHGTAAHVLVPIFSALVIVQTSRVSASLSRLGGPISWKRTAMRRAVILQRKSPPCGGLFLCSGQRHTGYCGVRAWHFSRSWSPIRHTLSLAHSAMFLTIHSLPSSSTSLASYLSHRMPVRVNESPVWTALRVS